MRQRSPTVRSATTLITLLSRKTKAISSSTVPRCVDTNGRSTRRPIERKNIMTRRLWIGSIARIISARSVVLPTYRPARKAPRLADSSRALLTAAPITHSAERGDRRQIGVADQQMPERQVRALAPAEPPDQRRPARSRQWPA